MTILLNAQGRPEPSPEVTRRLLAIDPGLFLRFIDHLGAFWAVCWAWPKHDARWAGVQDGSVDPAKAFDIVGYLPMDCPVESAPSYLEKMLRTFPREEVQRIADGVFRFNQSGAAVQDEVDKAIGEVLDGADPTGKTRTRRGRKVEVEKVV